MAVIELKKTVTATETSRLVTICAVTNNTLERTFNLSVIAELTMRFNNKCKLICVHTVAREGVTQGMYLTEHICESPTMLLVAYREEV